MAAYEAVVGAGAIEEIRQLAAPLKGARVLHLTMTPFGAGAPDELIGMVPLMRDVGIDAEWQVVRGRVEFARANRAIGDALGGLKVQLPDALVDMWLRFSAMNAELFDGKYDFVVVHDPQTAGIRQALPTHAIQSSGKWIWYCHTDIRSAHRKVWEVLRGFLDCCYDATIFATQEYSRTDFDVPFRATVPPTIDPLSTKDMEVDADTIRSVVERYGVDPNRPYAAQVGRFIRWSDPGGVIDAYRVAKQSVPELQLVLLWALPSASAESWRHYQRVAARAGTDEDIHLLTNLNEVGNLELNVFERAAQVVLHRALRKGFATAIAEACWKARPVVVDTAAVMPGQVLDGRTGYVVDGIEQMAERLVQLLKDKPLADRMGMAGHEYVRERFLVTRALRDYLGLFNGLKGSTAVEAGRT